VQGRRETEPARRHLYVFPGLSVFLTANYLLPGRIWQNDRQSSAIALEVSRGIGFASATFCTAWILEKQSRSKKHGPLPGVAPVLTARAREVRSQSQHFR